MGEELLPGLVKVIEERMGKLGRPFTTAIILAAGVGVIAWGFGVFYSNILAPILELVGVTVDSGLVRSLVAFAVLLFIVAVFILVVYYGIGWIGRRGVNARLQALETELAELKTGRDADVEWGTGGSQTCPEEKRPLGLRSNRRSRQLWFATRSSDCSSS